MINRNRYDLNRQRRYPEPFEDEEVTAEREGYIKWFGLWLKEPTLFALGFGLAGLTLVLVLARALLAGRAPWLPVGELWFEIGFLASVVLISIVTLSMFVSGSVAIRQQIRQMNAEMARWDDATPEEVEEIVRAADRRLDRRMWRRGLVWMVAIVVLVAVFGTPLLFPWGGTVAFVVSTVVFVTLNFLWNWQGSRICSLAVRRIKRSP